MPIIEMHLLEGRSVEKKRKAVAAMTAALVEALEVLTTAATLVRLTEIAKRYKVPAETVRILITEHAAENFSVAGVTMGQRNEAAGKSNN